MPTLEKAKLQPINGDKNPEPIGDAVDVQFNPASLHFALQSASDTGKSTGNQAVQHVGSGDLTISLDLHFDSADEGTTDTPVNVRTKTKEVAKFMLPTPGSSKPPPRIRFHWGDFVLDGVMASYSEDVDLFSPQGVPLRAKVSISIRGQNPDLAANKAGPGAATGSGATPPGSVGGAPGTVGFGASLSVGASLGLAGGLALGGGVGIGVGVGGLSLGDRTGIAIGGESAAEFAARMGADPSAWRGIAAGLDSTLSLDAGAEIDFSSDLSANVGVGAAVGIESGASASVEASVGLGGETAAPPRSGAAPGTSSGMALAAAGGVQAAVSTVQVASTTAAAAGAKQAYGLPAPPAAVAAADALTPPAALQPRTPLRAAALPVAAAQRPSPPAPPPPRADARATSFGYGVPLRPALGGAAESRAGALGGVVAVAARERPAVEVPVTPDPTQAPWLALAPAVGRRAGVSPGGRPDCPCGCGGSSAAGGCGCGGGC